MLTICHREKNGTEHLYEVRNLTWDADGLTVDDAEGETWTIPMDRSEECNPDDMVPLVFVMNEAGKTVAKYSL